MYVKAENRMITHIILVLKLCCEDNSMGGFCQGAILGYLLLMQSHPLNVLVLFDMGLRMLTISQLQMKQKDV